ncbi:unnamed protein product [Lupinus luteus]|uniref:Uncharacterized protein n=1 Tax=Lupinus luteus TaxID=3873 RepID=A0AAV1YCY3_LUPLU
MVRRNQYAPINYKSWKDMPKEHKQEMLKILEAKFEFVPPINDETRQILKNQLNEKWRQWKFDLTSMAFDPSKTEEQVASILPDDRVDSSQYRDLVHYWFSENGQKHKAKGVLPNRKRFKILVLPNFFWFTKL